MKIFAWMMLLTFSAALLFGNDDDIDAFPQILFDFKKDPREWFIGYEISDDRKYLIEYVLAGEKVSSAAEVVTLQNFKSVDTNPADFFKLFVQRLENANQSNKINSRVLKKSENSLFGEWWIQDNSPNDQHEWIKIFVTKGYISSIRYTAKTDEAVHNGRTIWAPIIGSAQMQMTITQ